MDNSTLSLATYLTNYLEFTASLWLAFYLLARGFGNPMTMRVVAALGAISLYSFNALATSLDPSLNNEPLREFSFVLTLVTWHYLSHHLLPPAAQRKMQLAPYIVFGLGFLAVVVLFLNNSGVVSDPYFIDRIEPGSPFVLAIAAEFLVGFGILFNLWLLAGQTARPHRVFLYAALAIGAAALLYIVVSTQLPISAPRYVATLFILIVFSLLCYGVARYQILILHRISFADLPASAITVLGVTTLYTVLASTRGFSAFDLLLVSTLAVLSHSAYDLVHQYLDYLFQRQERKTRKAIHQLARKTGSEGDLRGALMRGLAMLCENLQVGAAFVARLESSTAKVVASINSFPSGTDVPAQALIQQTTVQPLEEFGEKIACLAPARSGGRQLGVVGIGPRWGNKGFAEADLFLLEDFADQVGGVLASNQATGLDANSAPQPLAASRTHQQAEDMLAALAFKPEPQLIEAVEEGLRNLNDYIKLGRSPLVGLLSATGKTHIDRGKAVQKTLLDTLEKLRPAGQPPPEPLPREWHSYVILHDAYVNDVPDRDIMGKLYVSEGTFYRARRKALHGVSKALLELGASP